MGPGPAVERVAPARPLLEPVLAPRSSPPLALPESYGTGQLYLTARDPQWIYANWDFSQEEIHACNAQSAEGHMVLRIFRDAPEGEPLIEIGVGPQSRDWFVPVPFSGTKYVAQLGYFDSRRKWVQRATSGATTTPPDKPAADRSVEFATLLPEPPAPQPPPQPLRVTEGLTPQSEPIVVRAEVATVTREVSRIFQPAFEPAFIPHQPPGQISFSEIPFEWTPEQEAMLAEMASPEEWRRTWISSVELAELIKRQIEGEISSQAAARKVFEGIAPGGPSSPVGGPSSPVEKSVARRGFWFQVNAELVVYGATEPDATVTIGGRLIRLGPDGRFSFRFALPDGDYFLPIAAQSADRVETRRADLAFARHSHYTDGVGIDAQDPRLKPPVPDAIV